jgi:hypothetical protein
LNLLKGVTASDFDVVLMDYLYTPANVPTGPGPTIASFTASAQTVSAGTPVTLSWSESNVSYTIIAPQVGPMRGSSATVTPAATTTYMLYATNRFGRSTAKVTVTVQ